MITVLLAFFPLYVLGGGSSFLGWPKTMKTLSIKEAFGSSHVATWVDHGVHDFHRPDSKNQEYPLKATTGSHDELRNPSGSHDYLLDNVKYSPPSRISKRKAKEGIYASKNNIEHASLSADHLNGASPSEAERRDSAISLSSEKPKFEIDEKRYLEHSARKVTFEEKLKRGETPSTDDFEMFGSQTGQWKLPVRQKK